MKTIRFTLSAICAVALLTMASCAGEAEKTTKTVGDKMEKAADKAGDEMKKAGDDMKDAANDAADKMEDSVDKMATKGTDFAEGSWGYGVQDFMDNGSGTKSFDLDKITEEKGDLSPEGDQQLADLAALLQAHPELKAEIQAHTPEAKMATGQAAKKVASEARAQWVKVKLKLKGVDGDQLSAKGYGGSMPLESMDAKDDKQRRLAVQFSK